MVQKLRSPAVFFVGGSLLIFALIQFLIETGKLNPYWQTILFWGAAMTMVSLGLNLIYGFNGQFCLSQYGFYAIGAYTSADITWRWVRGDPSGLVVVIGGAILALLLMWGVASFLKRFYGVSVLTEFVFHSLATAIGFTIALKVFRPYLGPYVYSLIQSLPEQSWPCF